jgi:2-deoxy-D-gluconate 3-dehydrogenase
MDLFDLRQRVAVVTGGNGGIGLGIARGLAQAGADLVIAGRNEAKNADAVAALERFGVRVIGVAGDVCDEAHVGRLFAEAGERLGGVDILIANAGTNLRKRPEEYTLAEWHHLIDANLTSAFVCCQAAYPAMKRRGGGKIVTIGSMTSLQGFDMAAIYAASKGGVVQLTRSLASAWARDHIQVNCILPGWIDTDLTRRGRQAIPDLHDKVVARTPAGRWGNPEDLAGAAVFLCSRASDFVTGTAIPVDGGFSSSLF